MWIRRVPDVISDDVVFDNGVFDDVVSDVATGDVVTDNAVVTVNVHSFRLGTTSTIHGRVNKHSCLGKLPPVSLHSTLPLLELSLHFSYP
jgi:hypothetical protein